jgi:hypothetical protein
MPLNTNLLRAPAAIEFPDQFNRLAQFSQIQNAQNQNALAQYQLSAAQRAEAESEGVRNYFAGAKDFESPEFQRGLMAVSPSKALEYSKALETTRAQRSSTSLNDARAREIVQKLTDAGESKSVNDLLRLNSSDDARAALQTAITNKEITPERAALIIQTLPADPAQFPNWKLKTMYSLLTPAQRLEMTTTSQDTGGKARVIQTPKFAGGDISAGVVPGSEVTKTATPGELLTNARALEKHADELKHWDKLDANEKARLQETYRNNNLQDARSRATLAETAANNARVDRRKAEEFGLKKEEFGLKKEELGLKKEEFANKQPGAQDQANALKALKTAGFNPETGEDEVSNLIKKSTSGAIGSIADIAAGAFGKSTEGAKAISQIETRINRIALDLSGGKLGAGISNQDRDFIVATLGDAANPLKPKETRLAAWNDAKQRMISSGMISAPATGGASSTPSVVDFRSLK